MYVNGIEDVSKLTNIPKDFLDKLPPRISYSISNAIEETLIAEDGFVEYDLGFGILRLLIEDNKIKYKFVPSAELEESLLNTVRKEHNTLKSELESSLPNKVLRQYKELV